MKTRILAGIIFSGILATSVAQAGTYPSIEEFYSGMTAAEAQQAKQAAAQESTTSKATCNWHEAKSEAEADQLHAAYPGSESDFGEKDYLASSNQDFVC